MTGVGMEPAAAAATGKDVAEDYVVAVAAAAAAGKEDEDDDAEWRKEAVVAAAAETETETGMNGSQLPCLTHTQKKKSM